MKSSSSIPARPTGNMVGRTRTSDSQVTTYTYDFRNRLTEVLIKTSTGTTVQDDKFTYDVENRRIGKNTLSGGQSWTGYDGVNPYADFNSSGSLTYRYLYGNAIDFLLARVDTAGNAMWYLTDKLGSIREDVNPSGSVLDSITYDSYGNILTESSPSSGDRFKFTGREWDSEIGQYFYRARSYGPAIGRFESEDPVAFAGGDTDLYRYVRNSPTNKWDPQGLKGFGAPLPNPVVTDEPSGGSPVSLPNPYNMQNLVVLGIILGLVAEKPVPGQLKPPVKPKPPVGMLVGGLIGLGILGAAAGIWPEWFTWLLPAEGGGGGPIGPDGPIDQEPQENCYCCAVDPQDGKADFLGKMSMEECAIAATAGAASMWWCDADSSCKHPAPNN